MTEIDRNYRPLGLVSDFVVEQMPMLLEGIRVGKGRVDYLAQTAESLVVGLSPDGLNQVLTSPEDRDLAGLDLKMIDAAIVHSDGISSVHLTNLIDRFAVATDQPTGITYEEIILINPISDRRIFTRGEAGKTEADFYEGHRVIEAHLDNAIAIVYGDINLLDQQGEQEVRRVARDLDAIFADINAVIGRTHAIRAQNRQHFREEFRPYLKTHPIRKTNGPSGAFTAGMPTLDLLLGGENLPSDYQPKLDENYIYFPRRGRKQIDKARLIVQQGLSLNSLSQRLGRPPSLNASIEQFSDLIRHFRGVHYKLVNEQMPEALSGEVAGTGGEQDSGKLLRERLKIRHIGDKNSE